MDTQTAVFWQDMARPQHANVDAHVAAVPTGSVIFVSVVTLGEIQFGHQSTTTPDPIKQAKLNTFLQQSFPPALQVSRHTSQPYGTIRALLFQKYPPPGKRQRRPEQCFDPITSLELGIDENDLWIAAQAVEHNMVLVTHDRMVRIRDVAGHLLAVEDWTQP